jgi:hypothetical protein
MLISARRQFLFVHVYKTAGNSIVRALEPHACRPGSWRWANLWQNLGASREIRAAALLPKHAPVREIQQALRPEIWSGLFKFAFVRNPWDWQVSLYHYVLAHPENETHAKAIELGSFEAYIRWRAGQVRTQTEILRDCNGQIGVDFLGKVEQIEQDFARICERLDLKLHLPHTNRSDHRPYTEYYTPATRDLVGQLYEIDCRNFGYTFGG